jgi:predicted nucleic acid-binding protein
MGRPRQRRAWADTNLFLAFLAGPSHVHHGKAVTLFAAVERGELILVVTPVVVAEITWAAHRTLGWDRPTTARALASILAEPGLVATDRVLLMRTLSLMDAHPRLDFTDAWIASSALGTSQARVSSFDRDLDGIEGLERIDSPERADAA